MIVKGPKDLTVGNVYMYSRWSSLSSKLNVGVCTSIHETCATFKDVGSPYLSDCKVDFIKEHYPNVEYNKIADYNKRIFDAYNKKVLSFQCELSAIWEDKFKPKRKRKNKIKKFFKRWFK